MIDPKIWEAWWWEAWPVFFGYACHLAAEYPDDINRFKAKKRWKSENMQANYDAMFEMWLALQET